MTTGTAPKSRATLQGLIGLLGLFAGLCSIFALVVSIAEGWQEHEQSRWPQATARIQRCAVEEHQGFRSSRPRYTSYIECRIGYVIGEKEVAAKIRSGSVPSPARAIWVYPTGRVEQMQSWIDEHPRGSPLIVHYDPADPRHAVLVSTDMPMGGPRTPNNLRLLAIAVASCVVLLTIARLLRPRQADVLTATS